MSPDSCEQTEHSAQRWAAQHLSETLWWEVSDIILQGSQLTGEFVKNEDSWASSPQTLTQNAGAWEYAF